MQVYRRHRVFRALLNASAIDTLGANLFNIVFLLYATTMPNPTLTVSLVAIAETLPGLLNIWTGYLADNTRQRAKRRLQSYGLQASLFLISAALLAISAGLWWTFGCLLAINILSDLANQYGNGLNMPVYQAILNDDEMEPAFGFLQAVNTTLNLIGGFVGVSFFGLLQHNYAIFAVFNALSFLLAAWAIWPARSALAVQSDNKKSNFTTSTKSVFKTFQKNKLLTFSVAFFALTNFIGSAYPPLLDVTLLARSPLLIQHNYATSVVVYGAAFALGMLLGAGLTDPFFAKRDVIATARIWLIALLLTIGVVIAQTNWPWLIVSLFLMAYTLGKIGPKINAFFLQNIDRQTLAASAGVLNTTLLLSAPVGQFIFLTLANIAAPVFAWWWMLFISVLIWLFSFFAPKKQA